MAPKLANGIPPAFARVPTTIKVLAPHLSVRLGFVRGPRVSATTVRNRSVICLAQRLVRGLKAQLVRWYSQQSGMVPAALRLHYYFRVSAILMLLSLGAAFWSGIWYAESTKVTEAEAVVAAEAAAPAKPLYSYVPLEYSGDPLSLAQLSVHTPLVALSNDMVFNTPIETLENYLAPKTGRPDPVETRKQKLAKYLKEKKSPFAEYVDVLAAQKHWKLMLAISFAESNMGQRCRYNNCSGIGGYEPNFRKYADFGAWMVDFNSLLERRYLGSTLERMNGVYVQPKNPNWLLATRQVLAELQERGIE